MKSKRIVLFSLLVLGALVLAGCQTIGEASQQLPGTRTPRVIQNVVATSCDGDQSCETNNLYVNSDATIQGALTAWQTTTGRIIISSLVGDDHDYACLDQAGLIFRSETPC